MSKKSEKRGKEEAGEVRKMMIVYDVRDSAWREETRKEGKRGEERGGMRGVPSRKRI